MTWTDQLGGLLKQYSSGGTAAQPAPDVHAHFDQMAQAAPASAIAEGLSAAFKSDKTPAFGEMLSTLFNNSSGDQKAGMLNQLLSSVNPDTLKQVLGGAGLAGLGGCRRHAVDSRSGAEAFARGGPAAGDPCAADESFGHRLGEHFLLPAHHAD